MVKITVSASFLTSQLLRWPTSIPLNILSNQALSIAPQIPISTPMTIEPLVLCGTARGVGDALLTSPPKPNPAISLSLHTLLDWNHILQAKQNTLSYEDDNYFAIAGRELRVDPPTIFCRPCRDLFKSPPELRSRRRRYSGKEIDWVPFHGDMLDLINCCHNPRGNCPLCQQFWKSIKHTTAGFRVEKSNLRFGLPEQRLKVCLEVEKVNENDDHFTLTLNLLVKDDSFDANPVRLYFSSHGGQGMISLDHYSSLVNNIGQKGITADLAFRWKNCTDSDTTFSHVENWIQECTEKHAECKVNYGLFPSNPPARLIYIESSGKQFRLEEYRLPEGQEKSWNLSGGYLKLPKYTALSYCWGTRASFMLRKHNLEDMKKWLPVSLLPKTLRDACAITARLRLRYIWIDRLCIIQDSEDDWESESSKMADVYRNAWCTISATGSRDDNGGCYFHRNPLEIIPLKLASNPFIDGCFSLDKETYYNPDYNRMIYDYLGDRAWTFQERNLSRRILHFAKDEVYWRCRESGACETSPSLSTFTSTGTFPLSEIKSEYDALHRWTKIVKEYSWGRLSKKRDKLPALSGMAVEMQVASRDTYLAGIWRKHILFGLCWTAESEYAERPELYRAPSWSWASIDSVIDNPAVRAQFLSGHRGFMPQLLSTSFSFETYDFNPGLREMASIEDVQVEPSSGSNPYGQVDSGWIKISSHLFQVSFSPKSPSWTQYWNIISTNGQQLKLAYGSTAQFDSNHILLGGGTVPTFCLALLYEEEGTRNTLYCLILAPYSYGLCERPKSEANLPSSNPNTRYQRVGPAKLDFKSNGCDDFLEHCTKQTVVIL